MLTHECKGNASYKHLSIKQENIDLYYKNKPRIFATVPFNSNALYLGGAPWVIKSYTQKHITLIQNEASPDKEKVAIIELDRID